VPFRTPRRRKRNTPRRKIPTRAPATRSTSFLSTPLPWRAYMKAAACTILTNSKPPDLSQECPEGVGKGTGILPYSGTALRPRLRRASPGGPWGPRRALVSIIVSRPSLRALPPAAGGTTRRQGGTEGHLFRTRIPSTTTTRPPRPALREHPEGDPPPDQPPEAPGKPGKLHTRKAVPVVCGGVT